MRRIIIIIGIVILLCVLGTGLYFLFFAGKSTLPAGTSGTTGTLPATGNQTGNTPGSGSVGTNGSASGTAAIGKNFGVVASGPVLDYFVNAANIVTAINTDGTVVQITSGQVSTLSQLSIQNILSASFSFDGKKFLVSFGDPANPQTSIFDIASKAWTSLNAGLHTPVWSPIDYRIAYSTTKANGTEAFSTIDASKAKPSPVAIETLHAQDLAIAWPTKNNLIFYTKPSAYSAGSAISFNFQQQSLKSIESEDYGVAVAWNTGAQTPSSSPAGLVFSSGQAGLGGFLELINPLGGMIQNLTFLTLPSKCAFAGTTSTSYLFCGVPRNRDQLTSAHLPDDYNQMAIFTSDDLYRINLINGTIDTVLNSASNNIDATNLKFFNNTLFFVNRYDSKLYGVELAQG